MTAKYLQMNHFQKLCRQRLKHELELTHTRILPRWDHWRGLWLHLARQAMLATKRYTEHDELVVHSSTSRSCHRRHRNWDSPPTVSIKSPDMDHDRAKQAWKAGLN